MKETCQPELEVIMDYAKKTVKELKELCKERGIKGYSSKTKGELVDLLTTGLRNEVVGITFTIEIKSPWIYYPLDSYTHCEDPGKWMLFYPNQIVKEKWKMVCDLFDSNLLKGVISMKCSDGPNIARADDLSQSVIILYCANSFDKEHILKVGSNLVERIKDDYTHDYIYYKTDEMTYIGTRKTIDKTHHLYKLRIEKGWCGTDES